MQLVSFRATLNYDSVMEAFGSCMQSEIDTSQVNPWLTSLSIRTLY